MIESVNDYFRKFETKSNPEMTRGELFWSQVCFVGATLFFHRMVRHNFANFSVEIHFEMR